MLATLIISEIKRNLLSQRSVVGLIFVIVVYAGSGVIFTGKYLNEKAKDVKNAATLKDNLDEGAKSLDHLYDQWFSCTKYQEISGYLASGNENALPKALVVRASAPQGAATFGGMIISPGSSNYMIERYADYDLAFVIGVVLSFLAIVFSYDAVSRDREEGSLKLQLSNSLPRIQLLFGKFCAILILLGVIIAVGSVLNLIIFQILLGASIPAAYPFETLLSGVLAIVYLAVFIWLGLWCSVSVQKSSTALAIALLAWTALVILSPFIGGMLAQRFTRVASREEANQVFQKSISAEPYPVEMGKLYNGKGDEEDWKVAAAFDERMNDRFEQVVVHRFNELTGQAEQAQAINFFSPYGAFRQTMEQIAGTGLAYHRKFFLAARRYRGDIAAFVQSQDRRDPESRHHVVSDARIRAMSQKPVDPEIVPRFEPPARRVAVSDLLTTLPALGYLVLLNCVVSGLTFVRFARMDVR